VCGVVGGIGSARIAAVAAVAHRGPDASGMVELGDFWLGHTRLSIQDLNARSNQPFERGELAMTYNGELWNRDALRAELEALGERFDTTGDTEVLAAALDRWGADALPKLQGMFAVAWTQGERLFLARDRFGEVPLHAFVGKRFAFASEIKALLAVGCDPRGVRWVGPGELWEVTKHGFTRRVWYDVPASKYQGDDESARSDVRGAVRAGSLERTISDVPVCTLLSGGIDSAAVAAHVVETIPDLVAYVAVMDPKSPDLKAARQVAEHLGIELREVRVNPPSSDDLSGVIRTIEMPHKAQVEIGWACSALADRMRDDGFKVTFSGEGSDELWASYGFAYHGLKKQGWREYRKQLFVDQHRKNFARCNKIFMSRGVECRLPFLNTGLVELALSLPQTLVQKGKSRPKAVLQDAHVGMVPPSVVKRAKLAFQDGMGLKERCARIVSDPAKFYRGVHANLYQ